MIFVGVPNMLVKSSHMNPEKQRPLFRFDTNGEYETEDKEMIERILKSGKFKVKKSKEEIEMEDNKPEKFCKKCGKTFDSMGALLAHHRKDHKE